MKDFVLDKNGILYKILEILPSNISSLLLDELKLSAISESDIFEIRLRRGKESTLVHKRGRCRLRASLGEGEMNSVLMSLAGGAIYAHRDTLAEGYISPIAGLRVGIAGRARYDGGAVVGISDICAFIFRISHSECSVGEELYGIFRSRGGRSMLIYSPPSGGKTTALRDLVKRIGLGGVHVCAVDERCEFLPREYEGCEVDILRGYKKDKGIEIAVRTLGAELVAVDELSSSDAAAVLSTLTLGVPFIATVHAAAAAEILQRPAFLPFLKAGIFETLVGIKRVRGVWLTESTAVGSGKRSTPSACEVPAGMLNYLGEKL